MYTNAHLCVHTHLCLRVIQEDSRHYSKLSCLLFKWAGMGCHGQANMPYHISQVLEEESKVLYKDVAFDFGV